LVVAAFDILKVTIPTLVGITGIVSAVILISRKYCIKCPAPTQKRKTTYYNVEMINQQNPNLSSTLHDNVRKDDDGYEHAYELIKENTASNMIDVTLEGDSKVQYLNLNDATRHNEHLSVYSQLKN
jgi:hypothetical protein